MVLSVFTNVAALSAQRNLAKANGTLETTLERLSSGLRINAAKDGAAALAISERMSSKVRSLDQARRNAETGISVVQTAESALSEMSVVITRLRELAVQAANGSNTSTDRKTLDNEARQLIKTLDQIASTAEFNGRKLLDGSTQSLRFQTGSENDSNESIDVNLESVKAASLGRIVQAIGNPVDPMYGTGTFSASINGQFLVDSKPFALEIGHDELNWNWQAGSAYAKARAINSMNIAGVRAEALETASYNFNFSAATANYTLKINAVTIFENSQAASVSAMVEAINAKSKETGVIAEATGNAYRLRAPDGRNISISAPSGIQGLPPSVSVPFSARLKLVSDQAIVIGDQTGLDWEVLGFKPGFFGYVTKYPDSLGLAAGFDLSTQSSALEAIDRADAASNKLLALRAQMGATQNRLESTSSFLTSRSETVSSARARTRDADFAMETALLTRNQILQQSASVILAQANLAPQIALKLLL